MLLWRLVCLTKEWSEKCGMFLQNVMLFLALLHYYYLPFVGGG